MSQHRVLNYKRVVLKLVNKLLLVHLRCFKHPMVDLKKKKNPKSARGGALGDNL